MGVEIRPAVMFCLFFVFLTTQTGLAHYHWGAWCW